jgi:CBS domain-containing protein
MRDPLVVSAGDSVAYCVDLLAEHKTGSVLVVDDDEHLVGIFTERDCVIKVLRGSPEVLKQPVRELMTKEPVSERPDTTIAFALNLMSHGGFRNLPIVDEAGHPVGVLSVKDVIDYLVGCMMEGIDGVTHSS